MKVVIGICSECYGRVVIELPDVPSILPQPKCECCPATFSQEWPTVKMVPPPKPRPPKKDKLKKPRKPAVKWTTALLLEALLLRGEGKTMKEIGVHYGVGPERARQIIAKANRYAFHGRFDRAAKLFSAATITTIQLLNEKDHFEQNPDALPLVPEAPKPKRILNVWNDEAYRVLLELKRSGMTTQELASHYTVSVNTMRKKIYTAKCLEEWRAMQAEKEARHGIHH